MTSRRHSSLPRIARLLRHVPMLSIALTLICASCYSPSASSIQFQTDLPAEQFPQFFKSV